MPRTQPLADLTSTLRDRGWTHLDARCASSDPEARAFTPDAPDEPGLVLRWGRPPIVHAIETEPFGPTSTLLTHVLDQLPERLELRAGPAAGGILAETHRIELLGPMRRMVHRRHAESRTPKGLVTLGPEQADAVRAIHDADGPLPPPRLPRGWLGVVRQDRLVAALGPLAHGDGITTLSAPRLARSARDAVTVVRLLAAALPDSGTCFVDLRADHRNRCALIQEAGFESVGAWERWWCVRRGV